MPHRIRRQRWLITARSEEQALALNRRLRDDLETVLLPALAAGFDEVAGPDEVIRLPRLEIRVRIAGVDDVRESLPGLLAREAVVQVRASADRRVLLAPPAPRVRESIHAHRRAVLERYLETGVLPWEERRGGWADIVAGLREAIRTWLADAGPRLFTWPRSRAQRAELGRRLLQLVPEQDWAAIARALAPADPAHGSGVVAAVETLASASSSGAEPDDDTRVWMTIADAVITGVCGSAHEVVVARLARALRADAPVRSRAERLRLAAEVIAAGLTEPPPAEPAAPARAAGARGAVQDAARAAKAILRQWLSGAREPAKPAPRPSASLHDRAVRHPTSLPAPAARPGATQQLEALVPAPPPQVAAAVRQLDVPAAEVGEHVSHAGLILLHPFLPRVFGGLGVARGGRIGPGALPRAAALLYFLATGREEAYEFELGLVKVLLGMPVEESLLVAPGLLGPAERDEVGELLDSVIAHWSALGSTSRDGLRASFLARDGLLREEEDGWRLRVEPQAFDMLLGYLPWSIGIVRLPWMPKAIFTEWRAP
jgi:hypothetical protein